MFVKMSLVLQGVFAVQHQQFVADHAVCYTLLHEADQVLASALIISIFISSTAAKA
jgi:hypothetical protein